jgi:hypothetical protein
VTYLIERRDDGGWKICAYDNETNKLGATIEANSPTEIMRIFLLLTGDYVCLPGAA